MRDPSLFFKKVISAHECARTTAGGSARGHATGARVYDDTPAVYQEKYGLQNGQTYSIDISVPYLPLPAVGSLVYSSATQSVMSTKMDLASRVRTMFESVLMIMIQP
jgi:hypothetical protein